MAKKPNKQQPIAKVATKPVVPNKAVEKETVTAPKMEFSITTRLCFILAIISIVVYANSWRNDFVLDDNMVFAKNTIVTQGFKGIPELLLYSHT